MFASMRCTGCWRALIVCGVSVVATESRIDAGCPQGCPSAPQRECILPDDPIVARALVATEQCRFVQAENPPGVETAEDWALALGLEVSAFDHDEVTVYTYEQQGCDCAFTTHTEDLYDADAGLRTLWEFSGPPPDLTTEGVYQLLWYAGNTMSVDCCYDAYQSITFTISVSAGVDCNSNGTPDSCDIDFGGSWDCNSNGIPDECETDCNTNGRPDDCDVYRWDVPIIWPFYPLSQDWSSDCPDDAATAVYDLRGSITSNALVEELLGSDSGVTYIPESVVFTGDRRAAGLFRCANAPMELAHRLGIDAGVVLSTGEVGSIKEGDEIWNSSRSTGSNLYEPGDADLDRLAGYNAGTNGTLDAVSLSFEFCCEGGEGMLEFNYIFASEEYNEYVHCAKPYNDIFGFFLGTDQTPLPNIATIGESVVSVESINCGHIGSDGCEPVNEDPFNCEFLRNNTDEDTSSIRTQMDGLTVVLTARGHIDPGVNRMKLAIADVKDPNYDSAVFIEAGSFRCIPATGACCDGDDETRACMDGLTAAECAQLFGGFGFWSSGRTCQEIHCVAFSEDCNANVVPDECEPDSDGDGVIDDCEGGAPEAVLDVCHDEDGNGEYECDYPSAFADECETVLLDSYRSVDNWMPPGLHRAWDLSIPVDFSNVDAIGLDVVVGWKADAPNSESSAFPVALRVTNLGGLAHTVTEIVVVEDLAPTAVAVTGPAELAVGQEGCFRVDWQTPCDAIAEAYWATDGGAWSGGPADEHRVACFAWEIAGEHEVDVEVRDTDGDALTRSGALTVLVTGAAGPEFQPKALEVRTRYHTYAPVPEGGCVRHYAEVQAVNPGGAELRGPIYLAFESLTPGAVIEGDLLGQGGPLAVPHLEFALPDGAGDRLVSGAATEWLAVRWTMPADAPAAFFTDLACYAQQQPPAFVASPSYTVTEGDLFVAVLEAEDPEGDPVHYRLEGPVPAGMFLDAHSGVLSWRPGQRARQTLGSPVTVTARAYDGYADSFDELEITLEIVEVNVAPVIESTPMTVTAAGEAFTYRLMATDADGDSLAFAALETNPSTGNWSWPLVFNSNGAAAWDITWDPAVYDAFDYEIGLTVKDAPTNGLPALTVEQRFDLAVTECSASRVSIDPIGPAPDEALEGLPYHRQVFAHTDPDGPLYYFLEAAPPGMVIHDTGLIEWTPGFTDAGRRLVRVLVTTEPDILDECSATETFEIDVADRNAGPVIEGVDNAEATEGTTYFARVLATDPDGDPLRYELLAGPPGMILKPESGRLAWIVPQTAFDDCGGIGECEVAVRVADAINVFADYTYTVAVTQVNAAPRWLSRPLGSAYVVEPYVYPVLAADPDDPSGESLSFVAMDVPDGMTFTDDTGPAGELSWQPQLDDELVGVVQVQIAVTDGVHVVSQSYPLRVYGSPTWNNLPPQFDYEAPINPVARVGLPYSCQIYATDPEGEKVAFHLQPFPDPGSVEPTITTNGLIEWVAQPENIGRLYRFTIIACDPRFACESAWYFVNVHNLPNIPPAIISRHIQEVELGADYVYDVEAVDPDLVPGAHLDFQLAPAPQGGLTETGEPAGPLMAPPHGMDMLDHGDDSGIDPLFGRIVWTPDASQVGEHWVAMKAVDPEGGESGEHIFNIFVSPAGVNHPPVITSWPEQDALVGQAYSYQVTVDDPDVGDVQRFVLEEGPWNAHLDPDAGLLTWTPTIEQVGSRWVQIRVIDSGDADDWQRFNVIVGTEGNTAPRIVSGLPAEMVLTEGAPGPYTHDFEFSDPDLSDGWHGVLEGAPPGMSLAASQAPGDQRFIMSWSPDSSLNGIYALVFRVTDAEGAFDEQHFRLIASSTGTNHPPVITSTLPERARTGVAYDRQVAAYDPDGAPGGPACYLCTFTLESHPAGATIDPVTGEITWIPLSTQVTGNSFTVRVTDALGLWDEKTFPVTASPDGQNFAPRITSEPVTQAAEGVGYEYRVRVEDKNADDRHTFSVVDGPAGMQFDAAEPNLLIWDSTGHEGDVEKSYPVTIRVTDEPGARGEQAFYVTLSPGGSNRRPVIGSLPITAAEVGTPYTYAANGSDADMGDALSWTLVDGPAGMAVHANTGVVQWPTPVLSPPSHAVTLRARDLGGAYAEQRFTLVVSDPGGGVTNTGPPKITSQPVLQVVAGRMYAYPIATRDDEPPVVLAPSLPLVLSGDTASWQTQTTDYWASPFDVEIVAQDDRGAESRQAFQIEVIENTRPSITSTPPHRAIVGLPYVYQVVASDPDDAVLDYHVYNGLNDPPTDMTMDAGGRASWTPAAVGAYEFEVSAEDDDGLAAVQVFKVTVVSREEGDVHPPDVAVSVGDSPMAYPGTVDIDVQAADDVQLQSVTVYVTRPDGGVDPYPLNIVDGRVVSEILAYTLPAQGSYRVEVIACDATYDPDDGSSFAVARTDFYAGTAGGDTHAPVAVITSPLGDEAEDEATYRQTPIQVPTEILGQAFDVDGNLYKYELAYRLVGGAEPVVFHTGYADVGDAGSNGVLGVIDPTVMVNGLYEIRLTAWDTAGRRADADVVYYSIDGAMKVGVFTMSFEDFNIPVSGIPISVVRTYDSRVKTDGDVGVGWKLELTSMALQETIPPGIAWQTGYGGESGTTCEITTAQSHSVTIAWPDGRTEIFEIRPEAMPYGGSPVGGECNIAPIIGLEFVRTTPGTSRLELDEGEGLPSVWDPAQGVIGAMGGGSVDAPWSPVGLRLIAADGSVYRFRRDETAVDGRRYRITDIEDRNGNTVHFSADGIEHSSGLGVAFIRGDNGRIRRIVGPGQVEVVYEYDAAGDLTRVIDAEGSATEFRYNRRHELIDVIDPRGLTVARNVYDDAGRLIESVDADGSRITYAHDIEGRTETITDRMGVASRFVYDAQGNILTETQDFGSDPQHANLTTTYEYDAAGRNLTKTVYPEADPARPGELLYTETRYDTFDNVEYERDINGNETTYTYNQYQQVLTVTSGERVTAYEYDEQGNLTKVTAPGGIVTRFTPDARGHIEESVDPRQKPTRQDYDPNGFLISSTDVMGHTTTYVNDLYGRPVRTERTRTRPAWHDDGAGVDVLVTQTFYDDLGRVVRTIDPLGNETSTTYNAIGKQATVTDAAGTTAYAYDARGILICTTYPDGSTTEARYDAGGRRIVGKDRDGNWSWYEYDRLGRSVRAYVPQYELGEPEPPCENFPCILSGQTPDRRYTETVYDGMGRVSVQYDERGQPTTTLYGVNQRTVRNALNEETVSYYDSLGQLTSVVDANTHGVTYLYDDKGRQWKTIFDDGTSARVEYDDAGRRTAEIDAQDRRTEFEYDDAGALTAVVDARRGRTVYAYDESGNRILQRDARGRETKMAYDLAGRLIKRELPLGQVERFEYDVVGNLIAHTDFNGQVTRYQYDPWTQRMTRQILPYTRFGAVLDGTLGPGGPAVAATVDFHFESTPAGEAGDITIAGVHNVAAPYTVRVEHAAQGRVPVEAAQSTDHAFSITWTPSAQDIAALEAGELSLALSKDGETVSAAFVGRSPVVAFDYTDGGLRVQAGGDGYDYDARGRLILETKAGGDYLSYAYADDAANTRTVTLHHVPDGGGAEETAAVVYRYDALGRLESVSDDGDARFTAYSYDPVGNRETVTYPNGTRAVYAYDALNRLDVLTNYRDAEGASPGAFSAYDYTVAAAGNRTAVADTYADSARDRHVDYGYDELYRLTRETITEKDAGGLDAVSRRIEYSYDAVGNRETMTVTADNLDPVDRCVTRTVTTYDYDNNDRLTHSAAHTVPLSGVAQAHFDRYYASRPHPWTRTFVLGFAAACLTALFLPLVLVPGRRGQRCLGPWRWVWTRWVRTRWVRARWVRTRWVPWPSAAPPCGKRGVNRAPRVDRRESQFDGGRREGVRARRRRVRRACIAAFFVPLMAVDPQAVDAVTTEALRVQAAMSAGALASCTAGDLGDVEITYTYDDNGNQIGRTTAETTTSGTTTTAETFIFDAENRLVGYRKAVDGVPVHTASAAYTYDADGIRTSKATAHGTVRYTTDKQHAYAQVVEERDAATGALRVRYTYGDDLISQTRPDADLGDPEPDPPVTRYYHYDGQMSTRQLTDDNAVPAAVAVTDRYTYDAFGNALSADGPTANAYRYTGEQWDEAVGQYYLRARYYDQSIARFLSRDSVWGLVHDPFSLHAYQYASGRPTMFQDRNGNYATAIETTFSVASLAYLASTIILVYSGVQVLKGLITLSQELLRELSQSRLAAGLIALLLSHKDRVKEAWQKAKDAAAKALRKTRQQLRRMRLKPFFVIKSIMPAIYAFNMAALAAMPIWYVLTYNGPNNPATLRNRRFIRRKFAYLRATAPPWYQLDEFPYASTWEGGAGAWGAMVPAWENAAQGGYLWAHYRGVLGARPGAKFLVVPVPV